jgi:hypothetical protein
MRTAILALSPIKTTWTVYLKTLHSCSNEATSTTVKMHVATDVVWIRLLMTGWSAPLRDQASRRLFK